MKSATLLFVLSCGLGYGQSGIIVSGASVSNAHGTLGYSVGQIDFQAGSGSGGSLSAGNQQPFEIYENPYNGLAEQKINAKVYPNPLQETLTLELDGVVTGNLRYTIVNLEGKAVSGEMISQEKTALNLNFLETGTYFLEIRIGEELQKSFKLIKIK